jgi:hypothetical protein
MEDVRSPAVDDTAPVPLAAEDVGCDEDDELARALLPVRVAEEPPDEGEAPEEGDPVL